MAEIDIVTETEGQNQWTYLVRVFNDGQTHQYEVTLNWSDYDLWCHGRVAPEKVVYGAFEFLLKREEPASILKKFDCSVIRRYFPEVDGELSKMV